MEEMQEAMNQQQMYECLRARDFAPMEAHLQNVQLQFERGDLSEQELIDAFDGFENRHAGWDEEFESWVQAFPQSHVAHVAAATYFVAQAWRVRGRGTSDTIDKNDSKGIKHYLTLAEGLAQKATSLTAVPLLSYVLMGQIRHTYGNEMTLEQLKARQYPEWYARGIQLCPGSRVLRAQQMHTLAIEWGGSKAHLQEFLDQQKDLPPEDFQRMQAQYHGELAHYAFHFSKKQDEAVYHIQEAARLSEDYLYPCLHYLKEYSLKVPLRNLVMSRVEADLDREDVVVPYRMMDALVSTLKREPELAARIYRVLLRYAAREVVYAYELLGLLLEWHPQLQTDGKDAEFWYELAIDAGDYTVGASLVERWIRNPSLDRAAVCRKILKAAEQGSTFCKVLLWNYMDEFKKHLEIDPDRKYGFMVSAAMDGDNQSREAAMKALQAGVLEFTGETFKTHQKKVKPSKASLDFATYLRDGIRSSGGFKSIERPEAVFQQYFTGKVVAPRREATGEPGRGFLGFGRGWWLGALLVWLLFRACGSYERQQNQNPAAENVIEQLQNDPEVQKQIEAITQQAIEDARTIKSAPAANGQQ